jgi:hypothetical protein
VYSDREATMILTKAGYADHRGVQRQAVYNWVRRKKLTAPALRDDGMIDADAADAQLALTIDPVLAVRSRLTPRADAVADAEWAKAFADFMRDEP